MMSTLQDLKDAACQWALNVYNEYQAQLALKKQMEAQGQVYPWDIGSFAREGGNTSKPHKFCEFRIQDIINACAAGNPTAAHTAVVQAIAAGENWIGQTIDHMRDGKMPLSYAVAYFDCGCTENDILFPPTTFTDAKEHVWEIAQAQAEVGQQETIQPTCLSILADLYWRLNRQTVCDA